MSTQESDQMMALLQELSLMKEMDARFEANPTESEREAHQLRQQRKEEISEEMKALAQKRKSVPEAGHSSGTKPK